MLGGGKGEGSGEGGVRCSLVGVAECLSNCSIAATAPMVCICPESQTNEILSNNCDHFQTPCSWQSVVLYEKR